MNGEGKRINKSPPWKKDTVIRSNYYKMNAFREMQCFWTAAWTSDRAHLYKTNFTLLFLGVSVLKMYLNHLVLNFFYLLALCLTPKWNHEMFCTCACAHRGMLQSYEALRSKVTHLHSELKHQTGLIRKLRPLFNETRQGEARKHGGTSWVQVLQRHL